MLVDQADDEPDRTVYATVLRDRTAERRPVVPAWVRVADERRDVTRWAAAHMAHTAAYHTVRLPRYVVRAVWRAPAGATRVLARAGGWVADMEGYPLRADAVRRADADAYLKLLRARDDRVRWRRAIAATVAAVVLAGAAVVVMIVPAAGQAAVVAVLVAVLGWLGAPADRPLIDRAVVAHRAERLTSDIVERALASLGLAEINKVVAKGGRITFPSPIQRDGPGWRADVDLPYGVTVTDVMERRERLASGLRRPLGCVWPEPAHDQHAGRLVLWVGDQDMSQARAPVWPLARRGTVDLFKPAPFGADQRMRPVDVELVYSNVLIGAMPGAGKTMALRVLLLAAALDASAELRVFELKGSGDLSVLEPVAHRYGSGPDDGTVEATVDTLREVHKGLERRARTIASLPRDICPENKVTRELAARRSLGLHPQVVAVDECQELFAHPTLGKEAGELCTAIIKRGRALGVTLLLATQRPDKDSLPTGVSANVGIRFCLRVMGQVENDMVLGTSMYRNGVRATTFTGRDKGIGYLVGASDDPQIVRAAYLDQQAAERVVHRARAAREAAGTLTVHAVGEEPERDGYSLLSDLLAVVRSGETRVWSEVLCERLADLRPEVYGGWDSAALAVALRGYGITTEQVWGTDRDGRGANRRGVTIDTLREAAERLQLAARPNGGPARSSTPASA